MLYKTAKIKAEDITTEEYLIRKEKDEYTFHPSIVSARVKLSQQPIKGQDKLVKRLKDGQKV